MIPKKIHYVWLGHGKKSPKMKRCLASWQQVLVPAGYEIIDDRTCCCPDALLACMRKEAIAYLSDTRNIRDILVGAILS